MHVVAADVELPDGRRRQNGTARKTLIDRGQDVSRWKVTRTGVTWSGVTRTRVVEILSVLFSVDAVAPGLAGQPAKGEAQ